MRILAVAALVVLPGLSVAQAQPVLPSGFDDKLVAATPAPTALAFTPDGRLLIATQSGSLLIYQNGALRSTPALELGSVLCTDNERGLLGVAVDPAFASNRTIYLFYTFKKSGVCESNTPRAPVNRVSRFALSDANTVDSATERVLIDNIPSPNGNHNGGDLHFGRDGYLYVSVGDGGCDYAGDSGCAVANDAARDAHVLLGKILRITRDGGIPTSNPFLGSTSVRCNVTGRAQPGQRCQETFAVGLRNPFRIAFDPDAAGTRFFINDVGQGAWEEINLGEAGADYGWNVREGHCPSGWTTNCGVPPGGLTNPIHDYGHSGGCAAITGGAFVPNGTWGAAYDNGYVFADYVCGTIFLLTEQLDGTFKRSTFATGLGNSSAVTMIFGPHGATEALYYTTYAGGGQVRRIARVANGAPHAIAAAAPRSGAVPLTVRFDGSASSDPDGDALTFRWTFGDGSPAATGAIVSHTYGAAGRYTAVVTVTDARGASSTASVQIDAGNRPPQPSITAPASTARFAVGDNVTLSGTATDPEDGTLPGSRLAWRVILHHGTHTHPFAGPITGSSTTIQAPAPEDLAAATNSYLEIELTATDSAGLSTIVRQNFQPKLVTITFATEPTGLSLVVNNTTITTPKQLTSWQNYALRVIASDQTDASAQFRAFFAWSNGGAATQTIATPASAATYTATFTRGYRIAPSADAFVRSGGYAGRNFGTAAVLEAKLGSTDYTRKSYLRFDSSAAPAIGRARLRMFGAVSDSRNPNFPIAAAGVPAAGWSETGLTWNNRPASSGQLALTRIADATPRWYEWDVTAHVKAERAAGRAVVSFALSGTITTSAYTTFASREAASGRPELIIAEPAVALRDVVLYAADASIVSGTWQRVPDTTAAGGVRLSEPDAGRAKLTAALASPANFFEITFDAVAGRAYRLWIRGRAAGNSWSNDSAFVQFSGSVTSTGAAVYRIGTSSATTYVLEDCSGCGVSGWGWQDNGYGANVLGPQIVFATTGRQTIRIQTREDGLSIDQIVLSPSTYLSASPGRTKNDATILPK